MEKKLCLEKTMMAHLMQIITFVQTLASEARCEYTVKDNWLQEPSRNTVYQTGFFLSYTHTLLLTTSNTRSRQEEGQSSSFYLKAWKKFPRKDKVRQALEYVEKAENTDLISTTYQNATKTNFRRRHDFQNSTFPAHSQVHLKQ